MVWRKRSFRTGLLIIFSLLFTLPVIFCNTGLWADEGESGSTEQAENIPEDPGPPPLEIQIETSSANPVISSPWSIFVLINHPSPSEVNVIPPRFPPSLVLERVRTDTRIIRREADRDSESSEPRNERWTRVEFLFTPIRAVTVTLDSFEVTVPGKQAKSSGMSVRFREQVQTVRRYEPRFRWQSPVPSVSSGEKKEFTLDLSNWDPQKSAPSGLFQGRVPVNAILEESLPTETGNGMYRYIISIIALGGETITLPPFSFHSDIYNLSIPEIKIPISPVKTDPVENDEDISPDDISETGLNNHSIVFPGTDEKVFSLIRGEYDRVISHIRDIWNEGHYAQALAEIRKNERDSLAGPSLITVRKEMEYALGLGFTRDEAWRPLKVPLVSWVILGILIISFIVFLFVLRPSFKLRKRLLPSGFKRGFFPIVVLILLIGLAFIFLEEGITNFSIGRLSAPKNTAVLLSTSAFRVPEYKGAVNTRFSEGQPVIVGDYHGEWCYAESPDGRAGWIPLQAVIIY